jgi:hypothetical protein
MAASGFSRAHKPISFLLRTVSRHSATTLFYIWKSEAEATVSHYQYLDELKQLENENGHS